MASSLQMPPNATAAIPGVRLRGVNLSRNMFSRVFLFHPTQAQQLVILNMANNLVQSMEGI